MSFGKLAFPIKGDKGPRGTKEASANFALVILNWLIPALGGT